MLKILGQIQNEEWKFQYIDKDEIGTEENEGIRANEWGVKCEGWWNVNIYFY